MGSIHSRSFLEASGRSHCRFPIQCDLQYRIKDGKTVVENGFGQTINVSSNGVLFESQAAIPPGNRIELRITWPAHLSNEVGLQPWLRGYTVRAQQNRTAVAFSRYEFRTRSLRQYPTPYYENDRHSIWELLPPVPPKAPRV
jgi:hypothetical protein